MKELLFAYKLHSSYGRDVKRVSKSLSDGDIAVVDAAIVSVGMETGPDRQE
jgi:hypothetical protein